MINTERRFTAGLTPGVQAQIVSMIHSDKTKKYYQGIGGLYLEIVNEQ
jgi:hypothetical protein